MLATLLLAADTLSIAQIEDRAQAFRASSGSVRILAAEGAIDPVSCEKLDGLPGIEASGSLLRADPYRVAALPGTEIPAYEVSAGFVDLLGVHPMPDSGFYLASTLANRWEIKAGAVLQTDLGEAPVLQVFNQSEEDGRDPRLNNALLTIGAPERASECWVDIWPYTTSLDHLLFSALISDEAGAESAQIVAANPTAGESADFHEQFSNRITIHSYPAIVVLFGILGFAGMLRRRLEIASNLHSGAGRGAVTATAVVETILWATVGAVLSASISVWVGQAVGVSVGASTFLVLAVAVGIAALGASVPPLWIGEERLFRDFKNRT
ncbi:hypothetical protein DXT68_04105 [Microbacterium foliorum]|uniref:hypothetical protein n=1 Tax=Microbacterium foliorum TaxID=104336 RepID=UPI0005EC2D45|nr:hypothetical protein [Microbacterium foliorum]AXL11408.1 hypothetical protein DXT68_04105 [Microbacterium foliorum]